MVGELEVHAALVQRVGVGRHDDELAEAGRRGQRVGALGQVGEQPGEHVVAPAVAGQQVQHGEAPVLVGGVAGGQIDRHVAVWRITLEVALEGLAVHGDLLDDTGARARAGWLGRPGRLPSRWRPPPEPPHTPRESRSSAAISGPRAILSEGRRLLRPAGNRRLLREGAPNRAGPTRMPCGAIEALGRARGATVALSDTLWRYERRQPSRARWSFDPL